MSREIIVGEKVKALREQKNITTAELAERSGLSQEVIEFIESEKDVPALSPLYKIARALGVRVGTFLDDNEEVGPIVTRGSSRPEAISLTNVAGLHDPDGISYYSLAHSKTGRHMEPFYITLNSESKKAIPASEHEGEEFIFVLDGEVVLDYGTHSYRLGKGDSIYFDSIVKHHLYAGQGKTATFIGVVYTPAD